MPSAEPTFRIEYAGMYCQRESKFDGVPIFNNSDEPYVIFSIYDSSINSGTPVSSFRSDVADDVDSGEPIPPLPPLALFGGGDGEPGRDITIISSVVEHDEGDPDAYLNEVQALVAAGAQAGSAAAGVPIPDMASNIVVKLINSALGTGDDHINSNSLTLDRNSLMSFAQSPMTEFKGLSYNALIRHEGGGAIYWVMYRIIQVGGERPDLNIITPFLMFLNNTTGDAASGGMNAAGKFINLKDMQGFAIGWTHITPIRNLIFFYRASDGVGDVGRMDDAGQFQSIGSPQGFAKGWSHILSIGDMLFFYRASNGVAEVGQMLGDGQFQSVQSLPGFAKGWTHIVASGSLIFFYRASDGAAEVGRVSNEGTFQSIKHHQGFAKGWTHIVSIEGRLFFYRASDGLTEVGQVSDDGMFQSIASHEGFAKGWTHIVAAGSLLFFYRASDGVGEAGKLTERGNYQSFGADFGFARGWTQIVALSG